MKEEIKRGIKEKVILSVIKVALIAICYYIFHPPLNIRSTQAWVFAVCMLIGCLFLDSLISDTNEIINGRMPGENGENRFVIRIVTTLIVVFAGIMFALFGSPLFNSRQYSELISVADGNFEQDIKEVNYNEIPMLDKESAALIGNRKMGTMVDMVSQFEVSDEYNQINLNGRPVRVTPLRYASVIKWFNNYNEGIPAYIEIDMSTQEAECIRLEKGEYIKYSNNDLFNRNISRYMQLKRPNYMFESITFEIDDEGNPKWVCSVVKKTIGLFSGRLVDKVLICDAITGDIEEYKIEECPEWVDTVYSAELLIELYDYYGKYKDGFFNSILGQKGCLETTDGYNYLALNDDIWMYTGVTSLSGDESNVGFILMNKRTLETKYYSCPGAEEYSAMDSAEGQVQHLGYNSTFPLLINIANEPTYFIALKDEAGLVKMYAMVNIEKYQLVATGNTVVECEKNYLKLIKANGVKDVNPDKACEVQGVINRISPVSIEGNTYYYIVLENDNTIYSVLVADLPEIVLSDIGDSIKIEFNDAEESVVKEAVTIKTLKKANNNVE